MKTWFFFAMVLLPLSLLAQPNSSASLAEERKKQLRQFLSYVQEYSPQSRQALSSYIAWKKPLSISEADEAQRKGMLGEMVKELSLVLDSITLGEITITSWYAYTYPEKLPKMVWEAEAMTHIAGQPLPPVQGNPSRQGEDIMVISRKVTPDQPEFFVLFDENSPKILSWTLVKQGDLHYFLIP